MTSGHQLASVWRAGGCWAARALQMTWCDGRTMVWVRVQTPWGCWEPVTQLVAPWESCRNPNSTPTTVSVCIRYTQKSFFQGPQGHIMPQALYQVRKFCRLNLSIQNTLCNCPLPSWMYSCHNLEQDVNGNALNILLKSWLNSTTSEQERLWNR